MGEPIRFLRLKRGGTPKKAPYSDEVRVYADPDGALRAKQSDGSDAPVGGGDGSVSVTDGGTTVDPATSLDFASGATVSDGGGGIAQVDVAAGAVAVTDGSTTVDPASSLSFTGATVSDEGAGVAGVAVGGSMPIKQSAVVPVSSADLLAGTAVVVVPAVNDKVLMPLALLTHYQPGAVAYDTTNMNFYLTSAGGSLSKFANAEQAVAGLTEEWTIDQAVADVNGSILAFITAVTTSTDLSTDLTFQAFSAPTLGDGSLDVSVLYAELAIP